MPEIIDFQIKIRGELGRFKKHSEEIKLAQKALTDLNKTSKGTATAAKQAEVALKAMGFTSSRVAAPAVHKTAEELRFVEQMARRANLQLTQTQRAFGATASRANQLTRAATRTTAALGFISPTAATAAAQLVGITNASAGMTIAIGASAVGAIALAGALLKSSQAAIAFESSFRGIRKTVDATEEEYAKLERANRSLAISLGQNVNTINEIGRAAGQLGIAIGDLERFETIVIELASASDIGAKDAAFAFGGLIEILGLTVDELDSLTDQIVGLGNSFAATESEIVSFLNRIAGAGAVLGITAVDLASIATAFAALRIPAEAGGTAIQKVFLAMQKAAVVGGKELRAFADAVGLSGKAFRELVREDPAKAFVAFVNTLSKQGDRAQLTLEALGLGNERTRRAFLTAAAAGEHLNEVIRQGARDFADSTARTEEFNKELNTTGGRLRQARAAVNDLLITVGELLTPAIRDAAQAATEFAVALETVASAAERADVVLKGIRFEGFELPDIPKVPDILQPPVPGIPGIDLSLRGLLKQGFDVTPIGRMVKEIERFNNIVGKTNVVVDKAKGLLGVLGITSDSTGSSVLTLADAYGSSTIEVENLSSSVANLDDQLAAFKEQTKEVIDELDKLFKKPTIEETIARVGVTRLKREILTLQTLQRPLTATEKTRLELLNAQVKAAQRLLDTESLRRRELQQILSLEAGDLLSVEQLEDTAKAHVIQLRLINLEQQKLIDNPPITFEADFEAVNNALRFLRGEIIGVAGEEIDITMRMFGNEEVQRDLAQILALGEQLDGGRFSFTVDASGIDEVIQKMIQVLALVQGVEAAQRLAFRVAAPQTFFESLQSATSELSEFMADVRGLFAPISLETEDIFPDAQSFLDAMKKAGKEIDPLKDGIITLAEALEFGFTAATAATAELEFETQKLAARYFRVAVESIKLERAERRRQNQLEVGLRLAERNIEFQKELIELQIEEAVARAELAGVLTEAGLESEINTFRFAMESLGEEFQRADETITEFLQRLSAAATEAVQTQFDELFKKPTREEAQLGLQIAQAERQRALLIRSGAPEEFIQAIDDEIQQIQNLLDVRRAEEAVVKAQNVLADDTLLTQHEQFEQARLLTGILADEYELLEDLNVQLGLEIIAQEGATRALDAFRVALVTAQEVIAANTLGPGPGQSPGFALSREPAQLNFEAHFTINADTSEEIKKQIDEAADDALNAAGLAGSNAGTGTFIP